MIERVADALRKNGFDPYIADGKDAARDLFFGTLLPSIAPASVSYGDSETLRSCGIIEGLRSRSDIEFIDPFPGDVFDESLETSRRGLLADLFLAGANAVTEDGKIVNLDMVGNRVTGIAFGPRRVALFAGEGKIVSDREAAMERVKREIAPANARRNADLRTPCQKTGTCSDCSSPDRICNVWSILEKCWPRDRIAVVLIRGE